VYPKILNHVAVSVSDLDQAIKWYKEVFGFTMVRGPVEFVADDSLTGRAVIDIHGQDPNIGDLCNKISETGGKQRSKLWEIVPDKGYKIVFCEDPFGNIIEIYSNGYEQTITSLP
jgi:catechol 2,3-dioxygenase-like lactoylglutathione lyase family enzyme